MNQEVAIKTLISRYEKEYMKFMGITSFPKYKLELFEIKLSKHDPGFASMAQAIYNPKTDKHILRICTNLGIKKYVVFHEFTHILDAEMYAKNDSMKYACLSGYTEYHASQVELMLLLGADNISTSEFQFILDTQINTLPTKRSVNDYLNSKHEFVIDMMSREDFPADLEALKVTLGALYNYYGLRSICKMYGQNYVEDVNNSTIIRFLPLQLLSVTNAYMDGWFDSDRIEKSMALYSNTIMPLIQEYKLI